MTISSPQRRYAAWLRWYLRTHPTEVPSQNALARKLGIQASTLSQLFMPDSDRAPSFETMVAVRELTNIPVDVMMFCEPPAYDPDAVKQAVQAVLAKKL